MQLISFALLISPAPFNLVMDGSDTDDMNQINQNQT